MEEINKYTNGRIYIITDIGYNKCYYGSTIRSLSHRFSQHKSHYKLYKANKKNNVSLFILFDEYGIENCKIELVELFPCSNKIELLRREGYYIKNNDCINKLVAGRTQKESKEDNKEYYQEYFKNHYQANKEHKLQMAEIYRNNPEVKEKNKEYQRQYQKDNREKLRAYNRAYEKKRREQKKLNNLVS
jgi:hypothetical protein